MFLKVRFENNLAVVIRSGESKFEPTQEATTHFELNEGTRVHVLKKEGGWAKIKRGDGKLGWVPVEFVDKI